MTHKKSQNMAPKQRRRSVVAAVVVSGFIALLVAATAAAAATAGSASAGSAGQPTDRRSTVEPTTVPAPGAGESASVTVSRTTELVNQTVLVSWTGFRPSSSTRLDNSGDSLDVNTENPVRVYQCRGAEPTSSSDCYGAPGFRGTQATAGQDAIPAVPAFTYPGQQNLFDATPDGPANWQDNVTRADGTGEVAIQLFTKRESASLGCDAIAPCSIVVVPNYGRPQGATEDLMDAPWAWDRRTVVPLEFLPVDDACPLTGLSLRVEGSPVAAHALASWRARTCTLSTDAVQVDYTSIGEPQTRGDVATGTTNVGLVIDPLDKAAVTDRALVYAPVAVTGLVVAFQIDDANGKPVSDMSLNPRLVAKLITGSYRSGGDPAVIDNPVNLFRDPEFLALNPDTDWPSGAPGNHPLLLGDLSDTTLALTRWIAADPDAAAFLAGTPDPYGMTVNSNYKGIKLPFATFPLLDPLLTQTFEPIQGLDALSRQLSIARFPGALVTVENGVNIVTKPPRQNAGRREVIGIIDASSAARFRLSTAALLNGAGAYVTPTVTSMAAAIQTGTVNPDGVTRSVDLASDDASVYPLTLLISAALSTKAAKDERVEMVDFLDYVTGDGQSLGEQVGLLPEGHAPLSAELNKLVGKARAAVVEGYTAPPTEEPTDGPTDEPTDEPSASVSPPDSPGTSLGDGGGPLDAPEGATPTAVLTAAAGDNGDVLVPPVVEAGDDLLTVSSQPPGERQLMLPVLALLGLLSMLGGPVALWLGRTGRGPSWLRR